VPDEMDLVQDACDRLLEEALAERFRRARTAFTRPASLLSAVEICEDCDEEIPLRRRQAVPGCIRCIECQTLYEKR
jgi:phage/conjugal plasmid C-4 type zinc finger TraR family protein